MLYEVIVRKIVTQTIIVDAEDEIDAKYKGSCQASDTDTEQVLDSKAHLLPTEA